MGQPETLALAARQKEHGRVREGRDIGERVV
jgi:hypothetical protein